MIHNGMYPNEFNLKVMSTRIISWGPVLRAYNLTILKSGASTSWNAQVLSMPVMGLLCLYISQKVALHIVRNVKNTVWIRDEVASFKCSLIPIALPSYCLDYRMY
jgi:hypothetical protein